MAGHDSRTCVFCSDSFARFQRNSDRQKKAEARARGLLLSLMTETQRNQWEIHRAFGVIGSRGGRYMLTGNGVVGTTRGYASYCLQSKRLLPEWDSVIARKTWIEADEPTFRLLAVRTAYGPDQPLAPLCEMLTKEVLAERKRAST